MYAGAAGFCTRAQNKAWKIGDQRVSWKIYPGETISVCTSQEYHANNKNPFSLVVIQFTFFLFECS